MRRLRRAQLGYLAGAVDFDGHIGIYRIGLQSGIYWAVRVAVTNTHESTLRMLAEWVPFASVYGRDRSAAWKTVWDFRISSRLRVEAFLTAILPYLVRKRRQAGVALALCRLQARSESKGYQGRQYKPELQAALRERMIELNRLGREPKRPIGEPKRAAGRPPRRVVRSSRR